LKRATTTSKTKVGKLRVEPKTFTKPNLKHFARQKVGGE